MIMKKAPLRFVISLLAILCCLQGRAQLLEPRIAVHFSNPLGYLSKVGIKGEFRINPATALLLNFTQYWGFFPGQQAYVEFRRYFKTNSFAENFIYGKAGGGYSTYHPVSISIDGINNSNTYYDPGTYFFGGGGVGRHINLGAFFIDMNLGLKLTAVTAPHPPYNEHIFFSTGPGAIPDLNFHFGFQFQ